MGPGPGNATAKVGPEALVRTVVVVTQRPHDDGKLGQVAELEEGVTAMTGESAEDVRAEHRHDHRAVAPAGLPGERAEIPIGARAKTGVDVADDVIAQVVQVASGPCRVE